MKFAFIAKHRHVWPVSWLCEAFNISRSGSRLASSRTKRPRDSGQRANRKDPLELRGERSAYEMRRDLLLLRHRYDAWRASRAWRSAS